MPRTLPRLRTTLDLMPSPSPEQPGLVIRDPFRYSDLILVIPPPLLGVVQLFDGQSDDLAARAELVRVTGKLDVSLILDSLWQTLSNAGFLEDETFELRRDQRHREFQQGDLRLPEHAGSGYPDGLPELEETLRGYVEKPRELSGDGLVGIAAPHVSPFGGWRSYRSAYEAITPDLADRVFVILGTSHYGTPDRFGLTTKDFATPLGRARTEGRLVKKLATRASRSVIEEDYCHSFEHSIEFQVLFLQWMLGPDIRILPILCGSYARSIYLGGRPEDSPEVGAFLDALGDMAAEEGRRLFWVLGIDMAHMGRRYGDRVAARAYEQGMAEVQERDHARIREIGSGNGDGFWSLVQDRKDDLKWCGSAPAYTFLKVRPGLKGDLRHYEQWNIDDHSIVSFGAMEFKQG